MKSQVSFFFEGAMDTEYLRTHLGVCLTDCLAEVSEKRPHDPIEFVSQWLYKYIENRDLAAKVSSYFS